MMINRRSLQPEKVTQNVTGRGLFIDLLVRRQRKKPTQIQVRDVKKTVSDSFLLSEHIICKESIVIVKELDFEILTYLYALRSPEFIYAIFGVMHVCMCVCMCVCACVSMCVCACE